MAKQFCRWKIVFNFSGSSLSARQSKRKKFYIVGNSTASDLLGPVEDKSQKFYLHVMHLQRKLHYEPEYLVVWNMALPWPPCDPPANTGPTIYFNQICKILKRNSPRIWLSCLVGCFSCIRPVCKDWERSLLCLMCRHQHTDPRKWRIRQRCSKGTR